MSKVEGGNNYIPVQKLNDMEPNANVSIGSGNIDNRIGVSYLSEQQQASLQSLVGGGFQLAEPLAGNSHGLASIDPQSLLSLLQGLKAEKSDLETENQIEVLKDLKARKEESAQKTIDLLEGRSEAESVSKCEKAVMSFALATSPGLAFSPSFMEKYNATVNGVDKINDKIDSLYSSYYGNEGALSLKEYVNEYDKIDEALRHEKLDELMDKGIIDSEMYTDVSQLINGQAPRLDVEAVFLHEAINHADEKTFSEIDSVTKYHLENKEEPMSNAEFLKWFKDKVAEEERLERALKDIEEAIESIMQGASGQRELYSMQNRGV